MTEYVSSYADRNLHDGALREFTGEDSEMAFPLGGIGTGNDLHNTAQTNGWLFYVIPDCRVFSGPSLQEIEDTETRVPDCEPRDDDPSRKDLVGCRRWEDSGRKNASDEQHYCHAQTRVSSRSIVHRGVFAVSVTLNLNPGEPSPPSGALEYHFSLRPLQTTPQ